jgi:hypothetical protein
MKNENINWTKVYKVNHEQGTFNIYVSSQKTGIFLGAVLYYEHKGGAWAEGTTPVFKFELQQFFAQTEEEAYNLCDAWLNEYSKGKGNYTIELDRTIVPE